jgi:glycosyltransferase involved in cell wall biosynthesis
MRILYTAYPLLPVTEESAGGAEQMLLTVERELAGRGHYTAVAACSGSRVAGRLVTTGEAPTAPDGFEQRECEHTERILTHLRSCAGRGRGYDLVHDKSGSFWRCAAALEIPMLATLHLPRDFYRAELFDSVPPNLFFNCVSGAQARSFAGLPGMVGAIRNGIAVDRFPFTGRKRDYLLWLGRICEEKGTDVAIAVAHATGKPLILAGQVYPFSYHQRYFDERICPHFAAGASGTTFVDSPSWEQKVELLRHARALLVPSRCDETSSLVALEAMACGTPVIAFRRGGIPELVLEGETGWLVDTPEQMAEAVERVGAIRPGRCREHVATSYSAARMADEYEELYGRVVAVSRGEPAPLNAEDAEGRTGKAKKKHFQK